VRHGFSPFLYCVVGGISPIFYEAPGPMDLAVHVTCENNCWYKYIRNVRGEQPTYAPVEFVHAKVDHISLARSHVESEIILVNPELST
jgi:hypothetical protein